MTAQKHKQKNPIYIMHSHSLHLSLTILHTVTAQEGEHPIKHTEDEKDYKNNLVTGTNKVFQLIAESL